MKSSASRAELIAGAKPPSSPTAVDKPGLVKRALQRVENLGSAAQRLGKGRRADRHHHEFLEVDAVVGVHPAVEDVHHRHRQQVGIDPADIAVERQATRVRRRLRRRQADAEDRIGAEPRPCSRCRRARSSRASSSAWSSASSPTTASAISPLTACDRLADALAAPAALVAVAQLDRFVRAGRGARRDRRAAHAAVLQRDIHFDRRIAAAVEDLAGVDVDNRGHGFLSCASVTILVDASAYKRGVRACNFRSRQPGTKAARLRVQGVKGGTGR